MEVEGALLGYVAVAGDDVAVVAVGGESGGGGVAEHLGGLVVDEHYGIGGREAYLHFLLCGG